jgi:hypothetical protein
MAQSGSRKLKIFSVFAGLFLLASLPGILVFWPTWTKLQTVQSPDEVHIAELTRVDGIDRNYSVRVDGSRVYGSPDFSPRRDLPYREALIWNKSGSVVVLEIAGHRIFGYDAANRRQLSDNELLAVELPPDPPLWEYHFEAEWPGIGRADRPETPPDVDR